VRPGGGYVPLFPLTQKTDVNGGFIHPVWTMIKGACMAPTEEVSPLDYPGWSPVNIRDVQWNFEKVLFDKAGKPFRRYSTGLPPSALIDDINAVLAA
jgi:glutathione peroxidase